MTLSKYSIFSLLFLVFLMPQTIACNHSKMIKYFINKVIKSKSSIFTKNIYGNWQAVFGYAPHTANIVTITQDNYVTFKQNLFISDCSYTSIVTLSKDSIFNTISWNCKLERFCPLSLKKYLFYIFSLKIAFTTSLPYIN